MILKLASVPFKMVEGKANAGQIPTDFPLNRISSELADFPDYFAVLAAKVIKAGLLSRIVPLSNFRKELDIKNDNDLIRIIHMLNEMGRFLPLVLKYRGYDSIVEFDSDFLKAIYDENEYEEALSFDYKFEIIPHFEEVVGKYRSEQISLNFFRNWLSQEIMFFDDDVTAYNLQFCEPFEKYIYLSLYSNFFHCGERQLLIDNPFFLDDLRRLGADYKDFSSHFTKLAYLVKGESGGVIGFELVENPQPSPKLDFNERIGWVLQKLMEPKDERCVRFSFLSDDMDFGRVVAINLVKKGYDVYSFNPIRLIAYSGRIDEALRREMRQIRKFLTESREKRGFIVIYGVHDFFKGASPEDKQIWVEEMLTLLGESNERITLFYDTTGFPDLEVLSNINYVDMNEYDSTLDDIQILKYDRFVTEGMRKVRK